MKTIKELLILTRDFLINDTDDNFSHETLMCGGLCAVAIELAWDDDITNTEECELEQYLEDNAPPQNEHSPYWFTPYLREPRVLWLEEHIELNS